MTRDDEAQRGRTSKRTPYKKRRKCCSKFLSDRRKSLVEKAIKKSQRSNVNLEERKRKRKSISNIHLHHHHRAHLITILMRLNIEAMRARKAQIPDFGWFLRRISTNSLPPHMAQCANNNFCYLYQTDRPNKSCAP